MLKVRGIDYLRLVYGFDYLEPVYFDKLKDRSVNAKRRLSKIQFEIADNTNKIMTVQEETNKDKQEIEDLTFKVKKFQQHKCCRCLDALYLPAYHFFCNHSFHQQCLGENENVCSECAEENKNFKNKQRAREENVRKHADFFRQLDNSTDGFGFISSYFSRGIFDRPT